MSTPRNTKYFEGMVDQINKLGPYLSPLQSTITWKGRVDASNTDGFAGMDAAVFNFGSNNIFIAIAEPAGHILPLAMQTQSHAYGMFVDGSSRFHVFMETPALWTDANARFQRVVQQHILGQLAAPFKLWLCDHGTTVAVKGVAGAGATTASMAATEWLIPYGQVYAGGV